MTEQTASAFVAMLRHQGPGREGFEVIKKVKGRHRKRGPPV